MAGKRTWSKADEEYLQAHYLDPKQDLQNHFTRHTYAAIKAKINSFGLKRRPEIGLDRTFFAQCNTREKAYLLGVLEAEGCINSNKVTLGLGATDQQWLLSLCQLVGTRATIRKQVNSWGAAYYVDFCSKQWVQDLANLNFRSGHLPPLADTLMWHYLRGLFDGDGTLCWDQDNACYISLFYGDKPLIQEVEQWLATRISGVNRAKAGPTCWNVKLHRLGTIELVQCLPRNEEYHLTRKCKLMEYVTINQEEKVERLIHKAVLEFDVQSCYTGWKKELLGKGWTRFSREHVCIEVFNRPYEDGVFLSEDKIKLRIWINGKLREQAIKPGYIDFMELKNQYKHLKLSYGYHHKYPTLLKLDYHTTYVELDGIEQHQYEGEEQ